MYDVVWMCNIMWKLSETRLAGAGLGRSGGGMADMNSSNLSASAEQELAQAADTGQAEPLYILTSLNVNEHSILVN